jgi:hypothetical protein
MDVEQIAPSLTRRRQRHDNRPREAVGYPPRLGGCAALRRESLMPGINLSAYPR